MPDDIKPRPATTDLTREDPTVRARRQAMNRPDDADAFLPDPTRRGAHITANDAEFFGEEFIASATTGEPIHMDAADEVLVEEEGGPFLELDADASTEGEDTEEQELSLARPRNVRRSLPR